MEVTAIITLRIKLAKEKNNTINKNRSISGNRYAYVILHNGGSCAMTQIEAREISNAK
jgi:hypothetical protein